MQGYGVFNQRKDQVISWLKDVHGWLEELGYSTESVKIKELEDKLNRETFKVMVIGEFKRGNSTFINALLGKKILPAYSTPCTAVINEIKYGETECAKLYFRKLTSTFDSSNLPRECRVHIDRFKQGETIPPLELDAGVDLERYVVIPDECDNHQKAVAESPYAYAELRWPIDLCRNGVELIDSPGLNEHETRTKITAEYLRQADAIVFVMSCAQFFSASEKKYIEAELAAFGKENIFFVCNRFDQIEEDDRERTRKFALSRLREYTARNPIAFFVSASHALKGRQTDNDDLVLKSGVLEFEKNLEGFLAVERGNAKLRSVLMELDNVSIQKILQEYLPGRRNAMSITMDEIERRVIEAKDSLSAVNTKSQQILRKVALEKGLLKEELARSMESFFFYLKSDIPTWVEQWSKDEVWEKDMKVFTLEHKKAMNEVVEEVVTKIGLEIEVKQEIWQRDYLVPILSNRFESIGSIVDKDLEEFQQRLMYVRESLFSSVKIENDEKEPSLQERLIAGLGGFIVGGVGAGVVGGTLGVKEMLKGLVPQIALSAAMIVLGFTNPFVLIPLLITSGSIQALYQSGKLSSELRKKIAVKFCEKLSEKEEEQKELLISKSIEEIVKLETALEAQFSREIGMMEDEMKLALATCRKSEIEKTALEERLESIELKATQIREEIAIFQNNMGQGVAI